MSDRDLSDAIAYFRVSTQKQAEVGHGFEYYHHLMKQYGFGADQIYSDIDSGGNNQRKGYLLVLAQIKSGKKRVFVPDFTRFTRSPEGWEEAMKDLRRAGAKLITLDSGEQRIDTPEARLLTRQQVVYAAYQREQNQYKALKGNEFKRLRKDAFRARFPYKVETGAAREKRLAPNEDTYKDTSRTVWEIGLELVDTFLNQAGGNLSQTLRLMVARYGIKTKRIDFSDFPHDHSALRDWLLSEEIRGNLSYFAQIRKTPRKRSLDRTPPPEVVFNTHPALITPAQDKEIKRLLGVGSKTRKTPDTLLNPLQNLTFCAGCGSKMIVKSSKRRSATGAQIIYRYVLCSSAYPNDANKRMMQETGLLPRCDRRSSYRLTLETLENAVIGQLCQRSQAIAGQHLPDEIVTSRATEPEAVRKLRLQIEQYEKLAELDAAVLGLLDQRRSELNALLGSEHQSIASKAVLRRQLAEYGSSPAFWRGYTTGKRMTLYEEFVERVVCDRGVVIVTLRV